MATSAITKQNVVIMTAQSGDTTLTISDVPSNCYLLIFFSVGQDMGLYTTRAISTGSGTVKTVVQNTNVNSISLSNKTLTVNTNTSSFKVVQILAFTL